MHDYLKRQALTIGIQPKEVYKPVWVPHLPEAEGDCLGVIRDSHDSSYPSIAILPDGKRVVTGHKNGRVKMWNLEDGNLLWEDRETLTSAVFDISISPDGKWVASTNGNASSSIGVGIWEATSGKLIRKIHEQLFMIAWSSDSKHFVAASDNKKRLRIWDAISGINTFTFPDSKTSTAVAWSPNGGLISNKNAGYLDIIDTASFTTVHSVAIATEIREMKFSPDGRYLAVGGYNGLLLIIAPSTGKVRFTFELGGFIYGVAWSPNSKYVAVSGYASRGHQIHILEANTGREIKKLVYSESNCFRLFWSSEGGYIASSHTGDVFRFWDVRDLLPVHVIQGEENTSSPLTFELHPLPDTLIQLHRLGIYPPLNLVQNLLTLLSGETLPGPLAPIGRALQPLAKLRWPAPARIGLLALILHRVDFRDQWTPPSGISLTELRQGLISALKGTDVEPEPPPPPIAQLTEACTFSDQLITLLHLLGPEAVAKEPGLPLALLHQAGNLPPSTQLDRRLLGLRVRLDGQGGRAIGQGISAGGGDVSGIESGRQRPDWQSLLPTQLALPDDLFHYRLCTGELLYRSREVAEPPQLRPVVLLLDDSPAVFGKVEQVSRLAAFIVGRTLQESGLPVMLVTTGGTVRELHARSDLVEIFTARTTKRVEAKGSLKVASSLRAYLKGEGPEPVILLLTHPWFGEGEEVDKVKGLRGLFVPVGRDVEEPVLAGNCERYQLVRTMSDLEFVLGELVG